MEKVDDVEAKANLQPLFYIRNIDVMCPKSHCLSARKDKKNTYRKPQNETSKDKNKAKSYSSSTSTNQTQTHAPKKDKRSLCGGHRGHPATRVNATEVIKKDKVLEDLSHIECYTCHKKGHYATKCPNKPKN